MNPASLSLRHALLALAVMAVWGSNFVVIRVGLNHLPPLLFATLRFSVALFPAALFLKKPDVPWRNLAAYGVLIGAGQFGMLFIAMKGHISPGLASLVVQTQAFFTIALSMRLTGEKVRTFQYAALALAAKTRHIPAYIVVPNGANPAKLKATLGWKPQHDSLDEIVASALAWESRLNST